MEITQNIVIFLIILGICFSCFISSILHIFYVRLSIIKRNLITYFSFLLVHALNAILVLQVMNIINKLGLSWAKLSCQLGFGCTVINICCLILIYMK